MKYIIRGFETLGNVSHFTKIDAIGHIRKILPNKTTNGFCPVYLMNALWVAILFVNKSTN
jgi:hypothetical protein